MSVKCSYYMGDHMPCECSAVWRVDGEPYCQRHSEKVTFQRYRDGTEPLVFALDKPMAQRTA